MNMPRFKSKNNAYANSIPHDFKLKLDFYTKLTTNNSYQIPEKETKKKKSMFWADGAGGGENTTIKS